MYAAQLAPGQQIDVQQVTFTTFTANLFGKDEKEIPLQDLGQLPGFEKVRQAAERNLGHQEAFVYDHREFFGDNKFAAHKLTIKPIEGDALKVKVVHEKKSGIFRRVTVLFFQVINLIISYLFMGGLPPLPGPLLPGRPLNLWPILVINQERPYDPIRCVASRLMSVVTTWRNVDGNEKDWKDDGVLFWKSRRSTTYMKAAAVEVALPVITTIAVVESVVYKVLSFVGTQRSKYISAKLYESSSFTTLWSVADLGYNPFYTNIATHESYARLTAQKRGFNFFRDEDRLLLLGK